MKRTITINYSWRGDVPQKHVEALEEDAMERIIEMLNENFTSGELHSRVRMDDDDGEDGVEYSGWWESKTTDASPEK